VEDAAACSKRGNPTGTSGLGKVSRSGLGAVPDETPYNWGRAEMLVRWQLVEL